MRETARERERAMGGSREGEGKREMQDLFILKRTKRFMQDLFIVKVK